MKLLYKEWALAAHPTLYIFTLLGCLVMVPAYPYTVIFMFGCLAPYITFTYARETNDAAYVGAAWAAVDFDPLCVAQGDSGHCTQSGGNGS